MYPDLKGRVALVTGGSSGLGKAAADSLRAAGVHVAIADLNASASQEAAEAEAPQYLAIDGDVSSESDVNRFVSATAKAFGTVDILINCAGIPDTFKPTVEQDVADFRRLIDIHLTGTYMMC